MKKREIVILAFLAGILSSCIGTKDIKYLQPNENLQINSEGLVPYNIPTYRVTKNDIFNLNIVTTSKGDAAQFYSMFNTSGGINSGNSVNQVYNNNNANDNVRFYFNGIKVDSNGEIYILGIGYLKAEGRTIEDIRNEIQQKVNENFLKDKTDVRLNLDGITYYVLGDIETVGVSGKKTAYTQTLSITEALSLDGGLNRTVDKKDVIIHRRYPEGIKIVKLDLTREDVMNSPYYWIQNGDMIYLNTRKKSLNGFGKDPLNTLTTGVTLLTTALTVYLLISRL